MVSYSLDDIVREALIENGESDFNKYARFFQYGVSCLREMNMDVSGVATVKELLITETDTCILPPDYVNYIRIGICGADGNFHSMGYNPSLSLKREVDECGNVISCTGVQVGTADAFVGWEGFVDNFRNGEMVGRFFGIGGGNNANGEYRIDNFRGVIQLGRVPVNTSSIVLEYIADIQKIDGKFQVHPFIIETVKAWIFWKSIQRNSAKGLGEKQIAERDYWLAYRNTARRFTSSNIDEWKSAFRSSNKAVPKW